MDGYESPAKAYHRQFAFHWLQNGYFDEALAAFERGAGIAGQSPPQNAIDYLREQIYAQAVAALQAADLDGACKWTRLIRRAAPAAQEVDRLIENVAAELFNRGVTAWRSDRQAEALPDFRNAVALAPEHGEIRRVAGSAHAQTAYEAAQRKDLIAAARNLASLVGTSGTDEPSFRDLVRALLAAQRSMLADLMRAGCLSEASEAMLLFGAALKRRQRHEAFGEIGAAIAEHAGAVVGTDLAAARSAAEAAAFVLHPVSCGPSWHRIQKILDTVVANSLHHAWRLHTGGGDHQSVCDWLAGVSALCDGFCYSAGMFTHGFNSLNHASKLLDSGEYEPARRLYLSTVKLIGSPGFEAWLASVERRTGNAASLAAAAISAWPEQFAGYSLHCFQLLNARRFDEAEAAIARCLAEFPECSDGLFAAAMLAVAGGDLASAASQFGKARAHERALLPQSEMLDRMREWFAALDRLSDFDEFLARAGLQGDPSLFAKVADLQKGINPWQFHEMVADVEGRRSEKWYFDRNYVHFYPARKKDLTDLKPAIEKYMLPGCLPERGLIAPDARVLTMGSCFAENLRKHLRKLGSLSEQVMVPEGLNNTFALRQFISWVLTGDTSSGAYWYDRDSKGGASHWVPPQEQRQYATVFRETDAFVITVGLAEVWEDRETGGVFWRGIPRSLFDPDKHVNRLSTVDENIANLRAIIDLIRTHCGDRPIVITLSPVALQASFQGNAAFLGDCVSKSTLRVAIEWVMREKPKNVFYWPSFEIFRWLPAHIDRSSFGREDGQNSHADEDLVEMVMELFIAKFFTAPPKPRASATDLAATV